MARRQTIFVCQSCGATSPKWMGRCPDCSAWGSVVEEARGPVRQAPDGAFRQPVPVSGIPEDGAERVSTTISELDRVLGGGIVPGSALLLGGDPGVGKSTLLLQVAAGLASAGSTVLYVTAEESPRQIRMRAARLGSEPDKLLVLATTDFAEVREAIRSLSPRVAVLDSVQTLSSPEITSSPGSISQVREIAAEAVALAKSLEVATWLVGHVTKEGAIAGPRALEHLVDTVLYFEGDTSHSYRILRAVKNRYGSTNEIALLEMTVRGLAQVGDPSCLFLPGSSRKVPGSAAVMALEGTRPLMVEIQALVASTSFPNPRRTVSGADLSRVLLILAVLEKRSGIPFGGMDVFVNVAGGLRLTEPAVDLGLALALVSSMRDRALPPEAAVVGELGLSGEVRPVSRLEARLKEAARLGFSRAIVPAGGIDKVPRVQGMELRPVETVEEAVAEAFG